MRHLAAKRASTPRLAVLDERHPIDSACAEKQHGAFSLRQQTKGSLGQLNFSTQQTKGKEKLQKQKKHIPAPQRSPQACCESRHDHLGKID